MTRDTLAYHEHTDTSHNESRPFKADRVDLVSPRRQPRWQILFWPTWRKSLNTAEGRPIWKAICKAYINVECSKIKCGVWTERNIPPFKSSGHMEHFLQRGGLERESLGHFTQFTCVHFVSFVRVTFVIFCLFRLFTHVFSIECLTCQVWHRQCFLLFNLSSFVALEKLCARNYLIATFRRDNFSF